MSFFESVEANADLFIAASSSAWLTNLAKCNILEKPSEPSLYDVRTTHYRNLQVIMTYDPREEKGKDEVLSAGKSNSGL